MGRVVGFREAEDTIQTWATESTKQYSEEPTETEVTHMDPVCFLTRSFAYMYSCVTQHSSVTPKNGSMVSLTLLIVL